MIKENKILNKMINILDRDKTYSQEKSRFEIDIGTCYPDRFLLTSRLVVVGSKCSAQRHKRSELENRAISVPISEIIVIALLRSTLGMVHSN